MRPTGRYDAEAAAVHLDEVDAQDAKRGGGSHFGLPELSSDDRLARAQAHALVAIALALTDEHSGLAKLARVAGGTW